MKKPIISFMVMCALFFSSAFSAQGQLFAPFKSEESFIRFVQLPIAEQRFSKLTVKTTQKALVGEKAAETAKKVTDAVGKLGIKVEDETGTFTPKESEPVEHQLIPDIFPTDGDALLEVFFYEKKLMVMPDEPMKYYDGAQYEVKVEYKLYSMPDKELIEESGPHWVAAKRSSTAGPTQSREDAYNDRLKIARGWATREIKRKYSLAHEYFPIEIYTLKSFKGDEDDKQDEAQEKLIKLAENFKKEHKKQEYKNEVKEVIPVYENFLSMYKPGKDADVNDRNVFALYYNLAVCHYLIGDLKKAGQYVNKGIEFTKIDWKDVTNNKGEVIGRKRAGIIHVTEDIFHNLKAVMNSYYDGIKAHNPKFAAMLTDWDNFRSTQNAVRNAAVNLHLSTALSIDMPVDIVTNDFDEDPSNIVGTISKGGSEIAKYRIKKNPFGFLFKPRAYKVILTTTDESLKAKQHLFKSMNPSAEWDFRLPAKVGLGRVKPVDNKHSLSYNNLMYQYNGDITIKSSSIYDKWIYIKFYWVKVDTRDALLVKQAETTADFHNYEELDKINKDYTVIKRERQLGLGGFFKAIGDKSFRRQPISSTELSKDKDNIKLDVKSKKKIESEDEKGNWTKMSYGDITISRTIAY